MAMNAAEFLNALEEIEASKGISKATILQMLEESLIKAYKKQLGGDDADVRVNIDVEKGIIDSWKSLNDRLDHLWESYPQQRDAHAYHILCTLSGVDYLDEALWQQFKTRFVEIQDYIEVQKQVTRQKDDTNPFRNMTYWDTAERDAVLS